MAMNDIIRGFMEGQSQNAKSPQYQNQLMAAMSGLQQSLPGQRPWPNDWPFPPMQTGPWLAPGMPNPGGWNDWPMPRQGYPPLAPGPNPGGRMDWPFPPSFYQGGGMVSGGSPGTKREY